MDLIKKISSSEDLPEIKIIEFDTFSDLRGKIWTSFIDELSQKLLPDNIYFKHDKFNTNKNESIFNEIWGRPQNDGPALRGLTMLLIYKTLTYFT